MFLTRFSNTERSSSFSNIHNEFSSSFVYIDESVFPTEPDIVKVHKVTLFMTWFSNTGRSSSFSNLHSVCPVLPCMFVSSFFLPSLISWKYTRLLCIWPEIPTLKNIILYAAYTMITCPGAACYDDEFIFTILIREMRMILLFMTRFANAERPSSFNKNVHIVHVSHWNGNVATFGLFRHLLHRNLSFCIGHSVYVAWCI